MITLEEKLKPSAQELLESIDEPEVMARVIEKYGISQEDLIASASNLYETFGGDDCKVV